MSVAIVILIICGYLLLLVLSFLMGYFVGKNKHFFTINTKRPMPYFNPQIDTVTQDKIFPSSTDTILGIKPRPKPTQSSVMKFHKPIDVRKRKEDEIIDKAREEMISNPRKGGSFVL